MKNKYREAFDCYVKTFDIEDPKIIGKWQHSYRVKQKADMLAKSLDLEEEDIYLANIIGILHDIGRFKQWTEYHTFNDSKSIDHADFSCRLLFEENLIEQFQIDKKYYKMIEIAIRNHNKLKIEESLTERELLHVKIIRDADKMDIFYNIACLKGIFYPRLEEAITKEVDEQFWKHESVLNKDIKNTNDEAIRALCFLYDFNFKESLEYVKKEHYLELFEKNLNHLEMFHSYFEEIEHYIKERN